MARKEDDDDNDDDADTGGTRGFLLEVDGVRLAERVTKVEKELEGEILALVGELVLHHLEELCRKCRGPRVVVCVSRKMRFSRVCR
jgi:hypothetical protein